MTHFRSVFISDLHLGSPDCQATYLLDFLARTSCETLYLVGDIIDFLAMGNRVQLPPEHQDVVRRIMAIAASGTRVIYIPGNHDDYMRKFNGERLAGVEVHDKVVHDNADGRRFMVCHGDQFDAIVRTGRGMMLVGEHGHRFLLWANRTFNAWRRMRGLPYWSLATAVKSRLSRARHFIRRFELAALTVAERGQYDGFICGHIHAAGFLRSPEGLYCNDGDWVEHCTALVETFEGELSLLHWADSDHHQQAEPARPHPDFLAGQRPVLDPVPQAFVKTMNRLQGSGQAKT